MRDILASTAIWGLIIVELESKHGACVCVRVCVCVCGWDCLVYSSGRSVGLDSVMSCVETGASRWRCGKLRPLCTVAWLHGASDTRPPPPLARTAAVAPELGVSQDERRLKKKKLRRGQWGKKDISIHECIHFLEMLLKDIFWSSCVKEYFQSLKRWNNSPTLWSTTKLRISRGFNNTYKLEC